MGQVAADTPALLQHIHRRGQRVARAVLKLDVVVDPVADRLHPRSARLRLAEQLPGHPHEAVGQAVAAGQGEVEQLARHLVDRKLGRGRGLGIGLVRDGDHRVVTQRQLALGHHQALDRVAIEVGVLVDGHRRVGRPGLGDQLMAGVGPGAHLHRGDCGAAHVVFELAADP